MLPLVVGFVLALALAVFTLLFATTGIGWLGLGEGSARDSLDRAELLSSGDCVVGASGEIIGRISGHLGPSKGIPRRRYQVERYDRRQVVQVFVDEVSRVPCTSLKP
jgi:hypothetical protein